MMQIPGSVKHVEIRQLRSRITVVVAIATVVTIFSLVSTKSLLSQAAYQHRVIAAKQAADKQLQSNVTAAKNLVNQYNQVFEGSDTTNIIGGQNDKSPNAVPPNGDNARIILDALPSKYDFPALITSVSKILTDDGVTNATISGTDQSATVSTTPTPSPQPVPIQLSVAGTCSYATFQKVLGDFGRSIRPFDITNIQISGSESNMNVTLMMTTYYQPAKSLDLTTKDIH